MSRYIYITDDCLMDIAYEHMDDDALIGLQNALEEIPTADVVEVVHGEWIDKGEDYMIRWTCSNCGRRDTHIYNFCPDCGARMDGGV